MGGFGSAVLEVPRRTPRRAVLRVGLPDRFVDHGKRELLLEDTGLTAAQVCARGRARAARPARLLRRRRADRAGGSRHRTPGYHPAGGAPVHDST